MSWETMTETPQCGKPRCQTSCGRPMSPTGGWPITEVEIGLPRRLPPGRHRQPRPTVSAPSALRWIAHAGLDRSRFRSSDCERIVGAALAQPVLAVTSLAYVAAGIAVLCWAMRVRAPLAGLPEWRSWRSGEAASPTTGPSRHGRSSPTTGPSSSGSGVRRRPGPDRAAAVGLGDRGRGLRAGTGAYAAGRSGSPLCRPRQPVAVPRRLARPLPLPPDGPPGPWRRTRR